MLSINSGPTVVTGNTDTSVTRESDQGPSLSFQGDGIVDPRYTMTIGGAPGEKVYGYYGNPFMCMVDAVPQAAVATRIAAAQTATSGTPMTLVSAQGAGVSPLIPIVPFQSSINSNYVVTPALALDFGFCVAGTTASSTSMTIPANAWRFFRNGMKLVLAGAGAGNSVQFNQVAGAVTPYATTITLLAPAVVTNAAVQVGTSDPSGIVAWPWAVAGSGPITLFDPTQAIARGTSVTSNNAADTGWTVTVAGYDLYGESMHETISVTANGIAYGHKAFKYITSVTPTKSGSTSGTFSIGTSDVYGFSVRSDYWEYMNCFVAGAFLTTSTGWTAADATSPATYTSGDVRGTLQIGSLGPLGSGASGGPMNGSLRLALFQSGAMYNMISSNNQGWQTMFGNLQA